MYKAKLITGEEVSVMQHDDWKTSIDENFKPGDYFDENIAWDLINSVPPKNLDWGYFQLGEPHSHVDGKPTYLTLVKANEQPEFWRFLGYCYAGEYKNMEKAQ